MAKLDDTNNSQEVAFEFFKYAMTLDLANVNVHEPSKRSSTMSKRVITNALSSAFEAVRSGECRCVAPWNEDGHRESNIFTSLQLMGHFKEFIKQSGLYTNVESIKSLGWALKKYPAYVRKVDGRAAKYVIEVDGDVGSGKSGLKYA